MTMKKKYMKPEMEVVKIQQHCQILAGSNYGLNDSLIDETVPEGFAPPMTGGLEDGPMIIEY